MPVPAMATGTLPWVWTLVRINVGWSGEDHDAPLGVFFEGIEDRADDVLVDLGDGFYLFVAAAFVRGFVGRFDVDAHDIVFVEGVNRGTAFGGSSRCRGSLVAPATSMRSPADEGGDTRGAWSTAG